MLFGFRRMCACLPAGNADHSPGLRARVCCGCSIACRSNLVGSSGVFRSRDREWLSRKEFAKLSGLLYRRGSDCERSPELIHDSSLGSTRGRVGYKYQLLAGVHLSVPCFSTHALDGMDRVAHLDSTFLAGITYRSSILSLPFAGRC